MSPISISPLSIFICSSVFCAEIVRCVGKPILQVASAWLYGPNSVV